MADSKGQGGRSLDFATVGGFVIALVAIIGGLLLEGGSIHDISQVTAAIIVLGGTAGAVLVSTPLSVLRGAVRRLLGLLQEDAGVMDAVVNDIVDYAGKARKHGIVSLEAQVMEVQQPFLKKALTLAVDGTDIEELRSMMQIEMALHEQRGEAEAKVFECAGGYAPTVGIIGAVMGLIQVMKHLEDIKEVGHGIAVAFVATVYGVALANLLLLPAAAKIKARIRAEVDLQELMLEGVIAIIEGMNPKLIHNKLEAYLSPAAAAKGPGARSAAA